MRCNGFGQDVWFGKKERIKRSVFPVFLLASLLHLYSCGGNAFDSIAKDNSAEACRYKVSKDLDSGNWDAVINSPCAEPMDKGAAYFGKAGFDIKDVINRLSEEQGNTDAVDVYMKALVLKVDSSTLDALDNAANEYNNVQQDSPHYKDAQFYLSLVNAMKGLSLAKVVIDTDGDGQLSTDCDSNNNQIPDDVDMTSCALYYTAGVSCPSGVTYYTQPVTINGKTYTGLVFTFSTCISDPYNKRLISSGYVVTTSGTCQASDNSTWPCPLEQGGQPMDLVTAIDRALQSMDQSIVNALPGVSADVVDSIKKIRQEACGGDTCTSSEIADYLQKIKTH